jgi:hypothetical protein
MELTNQMSLLAALSYPIILPSFVPTPETIIEGISILLSVIIVSVGPIYHLAGKRIGETVTKNLGGILAIAALTDTALNIFNTVQNHKDKQGGSGSGLSGNDDSSKEDDSSKNKNKNQVKKDTEGIPIILVMMRFLLHKILFLSFLSSLIKR